MMSLEISARLAAQMLSYSSSTGREDCENAEATSRLFHLVHETAVSLRYGTDAAALDARTAQ